MTKTKRIGLAAGIAALVALLVTLGFIIYNWPVHGIPPGWSVLNGDAQWNWANGRINAHTVNGDSILASSKEYGDVTFSARASTTNREASFAIRLQDENNGYFIVFAPANTPGNEAGFIRIVKRVNNNETTLAAYQGRSMAAFGQAARIKVIVRGPAIEVRVSGAKILHARDTAFASGYIGFRVYGWGDYPCDATFSSVTFH